MAQPYQPPSDQGSVVTATSLPVAGMQHDCFPGYETYYDSDGDDSYGYEWFCISPGNNFCGRGTNGKR